MDGSGNNSTLWTETFSPLHAPGVEFANSKSLQAAEHCLRLTETAPRDVAQTLKLMAADYIGQALTRIQCSDAQPNLRPEH
jgi:hypothetical protein